MVYDRIIIGAGASGLWCAAAGSACRGLLLEKTARPGTKLLMSGGGHCNVTHAGQVRDFLPHYHSAGAPGKEAGSGIRSCLYRHNNLEMMGFLTSAGVPVVSGEDGRVFPASMRAADVLDMLLSKASENGFLLRTGEKVTGICPPEEPGGPYRVTTERSDGTAGEYEGRAVVVATGGCSYPGTGSDGSMFPVLERDLGVRIIPTRPALCPVEVTDFPYADLAGISFEKAEIRKVPAGGQAGPAKGMRTVSEGALLLTHRGYSGPAALNFSGSLHPGDAIEVNYIAPVRYEEALEILKTKSTGSRSELSTIVSEAFGLPKRFARRLTGLSGPSLREAAARLTRDRLTVQSAGDLSEAMVTAGGASLDEMDLRTMELKKHPGVFLIGEALDIDGDTGGYNLQFAYSSARAAADTIADKEI